MAGPAPAAHASPAPWQRLADASGVALLAAACFHEHVNVIVVEVARGKDSKLYPVGGNLPVAARSQAIRLAHRLVCQDHLSYRQARQAMLDSYGIRRSLGQVYKDVRGYACPVCEPEAFRPG
jgi:hypothetical protein